MAAQVLEYDWSVTKEKVEELLRRLWRRRTRYRSSSLVRAPAETIGRTAISI
jgi:hypothetical protein